MSVIPQYILRRRHYEANAPIVLPEEQDHTHPERYYKDLIWAGKDGLTDEQEVLLKRPASPVPLPSNFMCNFTELCRNCGWHTGFELSSGYASRVKVFHTKRSMALWSIGSKWFLRDQPNDRWASNDYITYTFLRQQPDMTIPLLEEMRLLSAPTDPNHYTLMSRAQGVPLIDVLAGLSDELRKRIKDQLVDAMRQLRRFTAPSAQKADGSPMDDYIICTKANIPPTVDEWFENAADTLRAGLRDTYQIDDANIMKQCLQQLKDSFPKCEPYVLTHGDLHLANIIVNEEGVVAIIDWEHSGYLPWWVERYRSSRARTRIDQDFWKEIWPEVYPEMDNETFSRDIVPHVRLVQQIMENAPFKLEGEAEAWHRPAWCECKPFGGKFARPDMGSVIERVTLHDQPVPVIKNPEGPNSANSEIKS